MQARDRKCDLVLTHRLAPTPSGAPQGICRFPPVRSAIFLTISGGPRAEEPPLFPDLGALEPGESHMDYGFGAYRLDTQCYELTHAEVPIPLRPKVFQVLVYLLAHHEGVVSKEELLTQVWPGQFVGDVGLNSYIMAVRKALGDRCLPYQYIRTIRGHGYRFVAEVTMADPAPLALARAATLPPGGAPPEPAANV